MTADEFQIRVLGFKNKLFRLSLRLLTDADEAADIVQDVYLKLWKMRDKLPQYQSSEALAMTMTKNLCLDELKAKRRQNLPLRDYDQHKSAVNPGQMAELRDAVENVNRLIEKLPPQQKIVMQLRDVEEYSLSEIAEITGMSENAARVNLSRARKQIREQLIKYNNYEYHIS